MNHIFVYHANCFRYATRSILRNKIFGNDDGGQKSAWNIATPLTKRLGPNKVLQGKNTLKGKS